MNIKWQVICLAFVLSSCDLGPLVPSTSTPDLTATDTATVTPKATETLTPTLTATLTETPTATPTALSCPKGTVLVPDQNKCFFATRTQKPPEPTYCQHFRYKWACINQGCFWDRTVQLCKEQ